MRIRMVLCAAAVSLIGLGFAATPASAVPGLVRVVAMSPLDSVATKEALAQCPAGTRVLGGGGYLTNSGGNVHLIRLQALGSSDRFAAAATENGVYAANWRVTAYAICGQQPAGLVYTSLQSVSDSSGTKTQQVDCPGGTMPLSFGARLQGDGGKVVISAVGVTGGLNGAKTGASEVEGGYVGNWSLWAHAVCANPVPGYELVWADALPANSEGKLVTVNCPTSKKVHGTGGTITSSFGEVFHQGIVPSSTLGNVSAWVIEDTNGAAHNWWTRVYAVCAF